MFLDDLDEAPDPQLMKQVNTASQRLLQLKFEMEVAENKYQEAKTAYEKFACNQLPQLFRSAGLQSLSLVNGSTLKIATITRCSLKKDDASRSRVGDWLKAHDAGSLVKRQFIVPQNQEEALKASGIMYQAQTDINTNSVKALLIDMLGQNGGQALINKDDIPDGISFFQWEEARVV